MDDFLYYLAERKYRMYYELHKFKPFATRKQDCIDRLLYMERYETHLDIISYLPLEQLMKISEIEKEFFSDAPYVSK